MIDSHFHLWDIDRGDYGWMYDNPDVAPIKRNYDAADYPGTALGVDRAVLVQAAPTVEETEFMLHLADQNDWIAKVVGWINFEDRTMLSTLDRIAQHPKFAGVRPMIQDIPDVDWMHRPGVQWAYDAIRELGLTFDALGFPQHIENFLRLFDRYPDMQIVVDHCLKPQIRDGAFDAWADGMARIAASTPVYCKLSGLFTEARPEAPSQDLEPYVAHVLSEFGPDRIMWGSDWPVLTLNGSFDRWLDTAQRYVPEHAHEAVFRRTAARFYGIL